MSKMAIPHLWTHCHPFQPYPFSDSLIYSGRPLQEKQINYFTSGQENKIDILFYPWARGPWLGTQSSWQDFFNAQLYNNPLEFGRCSWCCVWHVELLVEARNIINVNTFVQNESHFWRFISQIFSWSTLKIYFKCDYNKSSLLQTADAYFSEGIDLSFDSPTDHVGGEKGVKFNVDLGMFSWHSPSQYLSTALYHMEIHNIFFFFCTNQGLTQNLIP